MNGKYGAIVMLVVVLVLIWMSETGRLTSLLTVVRSSGGHASIGASGPTIIPPMPPSTAPVNPYDPGISVIPEPTINPNRNNIFGGGTSPGGYRLGE